MSDQQAELNNEFRRCPGAVGCISVFKETKTDSGAAEMRRAKGPVLAEVCSCLLQPQRLIDIALSKVPKVSYLIHFLYACDPLSRAECEHFCA